MYFQWDLLHLVSIRINIMWLQGMVKLYLTHWWRCNGPCQTRKPYFGIVRRSQNRAPGPTDYWWTTHQKTCGGTFVKFKEPEKTTKKKAESGKNTKIKANPKNNADITKYINNNNNNNFIDKNIRTINNLPKDDRKPLTQIQKIVSNVPAIKSNGGKPDIRTQKDVSSSPSKKPFPFSGKGQIFDGSRKRSNSVDVVETVRDIWTKKFANTNTLGKGKELVKSNSIYHNIGSRFNDKIISQSGSPPMKKQKIDDFFKTTTKSVLKDLYGQDFKITQSKPDEKVKAVPIKLNVVDCPICSAKIDSNEINKHLDECLNKDIIQTLSQINSESQSVISSGPNKVNYKDYSVPPIPAFKVKTEDGISKINAPEKTKNYSVPPIPPFKVKIEDGIPKFKFGNETNSILSSSNVIDLTDINFGNASVIKKEPVVKENVDNLAFDPADVNKAKAIVKKIQFDKHVRKSDNFIVPKEETKITGVGFLPSFLDDVATEIRVPPVKIEPGTSKDSVTSLNAQKCPCCGNKVDKPMAEHLDECLSFFINNATVPEEGASTSFANNTIVIDDDEDDIFDETLTMNATGTKTPCPCCMKMIEADAMNAHLDECLH